MNTIEKNRRSRRQFLASAAAVAVASPLVIPRAVLGDATQPGANEQVKIGLIGLGGRCTWLLQHSLPNAKGAKVVAACDFFQPKLDKFLEASKKTSIGEIKGYDDFRKMIETEKLDGVMVETATHQRAWTTVVAMQMGVHTYIEKPMCLTIKEGREMVNAARKYKIVTQVGTQQRTLPLCNWASDMVKNGAIGKIKYVRAPNFVGPNIWKDQPGQPLPPGGKEGWWDLWTNQATLRPFHTQLFRGWSNWWDYDAGGLCFGVSGWGTHSYDQVNRALGTDETGPVAITLLEESKVEQSGKFAPRQAGEDETGSPYYGMAKVTGPRGKITMEFANGTELRLELDGDWGPGLGAIFVGEKGKIEINRHKVVSNPKELTSPVPEECKNKRDESVYHVEDWVSCIKSKKKCAADIEYGQRGSALCDLVNIVRAVGQVGKKLAWDPVAERFTNCDEGNKYLSRPRREGWTLGEDLT